MALALMGLHQYSAPPVRSKGRPILGLWVFAQAVVFPFLFGWCTEPGRMLSTLLSSILAPLTGSTSPPTDEALQSFRYLAMWAFLTLWFMAKGVFKNVPDFTGDRAAGVRTSATLCDSQRSAALVAAGAMLGAYSTLPLLVAMHLEKVRVLFSLLWLIPLGLNARRLVRAVGGSAANRVLRTDMLLSAGFIATLLLLIAPVRENVGIVVAAAFLVLGSDASGLDSRRPTDSNPMNERPRP
jgi:4-hydroxybenzoate polyprenyltransferase